MRPQLLPFAPTNVRQDIPPEELGADSYSHIDNMQWDDGKLARSLGYTRSSIHMNMVGTFTMPCRVPSGYYWMGASDDEAVRVTNGQDNFTISPATIWDAVAFGPEN